MTEEENIITLIIETVIRRAEGNRSKCLRANHLLYLKKICCKSIFVVEHLGQCDYLILFFFHSSWKCSMFMYLLANNGL